MIKNIITAMVLTVCFSVSAAHADKKEDIDTVVTEIQDRYEKVDSFYAEFDQEAEVRALDTVEKANGKVWFKNPGKMRWDYSKPNNDVIVSDGEYIWYYNEQESQVMKSSLEKLNQESNSTTLISGLGQIKKLFNAKYSTDDDINASSGNYLIELTPKDNGEDSNEPYNRIIISVNKKDSLVNEIYLFDPFGNKTKITLSNFRINKDISDSHFSYTPPRGTEIVDMSSAR